LTQKGENSDLKKTRVQILTKKPEQQIGICILIENGVPCSKPVVSRGLCNRHRAYLAKNGRLEEFALPRQSRKKDLRLNPDTQDGLCRILENGNPCVTQARPNGLCNRHYAAIWQRPDLDLGDFTIRQTDLLYGRKKRVTAGICIVREMRPDGTRSHCKLKSSSRGLCRRHYRTLSKTPVLFEQIANPRRGKAKLRLKKKFKEGVCVIVADDVGCNHRATRQRRVCDSHYMALKTAGMLEELTDQFLKTRNCILERKPEEIQIEGFCIMKVNGIGCTNTPKRRGLCDACIWLIEKAQEYEYKDFALPEKRSLKSVLSRKIEIVNGICLAVEDGVPCNKAVFARGMCKDHYKLATRRKILAKIALTIEEQRSLSDVPHFFFDKNVPIHFAMHELFGSKSDRNSSALVDAVLRRRIRATVSTDCVRALYSHIGHRLARPVEDCGKGMDPYVAEKTAREYTGKLFFERGGLWHFLSFNEEHIEACTAKGKLPMLSLEDALEFHLYAIAKKEYGAALFVTADKGIIEVGEAVHPNEVVRTYSHLVQPVR
jgi:hypothetical protein